MLITNAWRSACHRLCALSSRAHPARLMFLASVESPQNIPICSLSLAPFVNGFRVKNLRCALRRISPITPPTPEQCGEAVRSEEHTSELQSRGHLVCRLL